MITAIIVEVVGLFASLLVLVSYLFSDQAKLRTANLLASIIFVGYSVGLIVLSSGVNGWSTLVLNFACAAVHTIWLIKYRKAKKAPPDVPSPEDTEKS